MKVICNGLSLSDAVSKVVKAMSTHTNNPVLECIKIKAFNNILILAATDEEIYIEKKIRAEVLIEGEVLVYGRYFSEFVRTLSREEEVEFSITPNNQFKIFYGGGVAEFACNNSLIFPELEWEGDENNFSIVKKEFKDLINKVSFSVATDDARPILKGVLLEIEQYNINAVALDGYRMAIIKKALEKNDAFINVIVNARCLNEISKLLDDSEDIITIYLKNNAMLVDLEHTKICVRLLSGDFINYRQIVPKNFETEVIIERALLERVVDRANLIAKLDKNNLIKLNIVGDELEINARTDINYSNEKIDIKLIGRDITIAFNSRYLLDVMRAVDDEFIKIKLQNEISPCIITPTSETDEYLYLILPVKI